jgi:hypothetical protein
VLEFFRERGKWPHRRGRRRRLATPGVIRAFIYWAAIANCAYGIASDGLERGKAFCHDCAGAGNAVRADRASIEDHGVRADPDTTADGDAVGGMRLLRDRDIEPRKVIHPID